MDSDIRSSLPSFVQLLLQLGAVLVMTALSAPLALAAVVFLAAPYAWFARLYRWSARDLRRLQATTRSPVLSTFAEVMRGVDVTRVFRQEAAVLAEHHAQVARNMRAMFHMWAANQWVAFWLEMLGCLSVGATCFVVIAEGEDSAMPASVAGLALSFAVNVPGILMWITRQLAQVETDFVAVERVLEYANLVPEPADAPPTAPAVAAAATAAGSIDMAEVTMRYSPQLAPALDRVSLRIVGGTKVAVVGRTGAGKSSILYALLRLYPTSGTILFDGVDGANIPLAELRRARVRTVLQDSVLFDGTVRSNLCAGAPRGAALSDDDLWRVLRRLSLHDLVAALPLGLDGPVTEGGANFSAGERQLLCVARALVVPAGILLCDEATANVDLITDDAVHSALLAVPSTVLFICHRLTVCVCARASLIVSSPIRHA